MSNRRWKTVPIDQLKRMIGRKVMSHDPGYKMIESFSTAHGPYKLLQVTKGGMVKLEGREPYEVKPSHIELCPKPDKEGIWEWYDEFNNLHLVDVVNIEFDKNRPPYLRVAWGGGYYNVHDECVGTWEEEYNKAQWSNRWGEYVGLRGSVPEEKLYTMPNETRK